MLGNKVAFGASGWQDWVALLATGSALALPVVTAVPAVAAGDRVLHATFGMGTVVATSGAGDAAKADVDFGSMGMKRLSLKHAPMEKL